MLRPKFMTLDPSANRLFPGGTNAGIPQPTSIGNLREEEIKENQQLSPEIGGTMDSQTGS